jgi:hypothetical protein
MSEPRSCRIVGCVSRGLLWWIADDGAEAFHVPLAGDSDGEIANAVGALLNVAEDVGVDSDTILS